MFSKLKQIQNLKSQANQLKSALADETAEETSGAITIVMNGNQEVIDVKIAENINQERLPEDIKKATNDAIKKVQRLMARKMQQMGGFDLPDV